MSTQTHDPILEVEATPTPTKEEAEAVLLAMAEGLFPTGFDSISSLTWLEGPSSSTNTPALTPEERLHAAETRFRTLVEQIPAVTFMAVLGEGRNEIYVSPHIEALLGFAQSDWLENPFLWYYQLHPDDRKLWNAEFARGCRTGGPFRAECRFLARDGRIVWVLGEARLVRDEMGRPQFLQGVAFDITENKRAQQVLVADAVQSAKVEEEHAIARRVQTSILPRRFAVQRLEVAAAMEPAEDVGGDYYDVFPTDDGAWLVMGDVSGHGLNAGLIMLMVQSALAGIICTRPNGRPGELLAALNAVLFDNVTNRLGTSEYVTLVLLRYFAHGEVHFAGAHEWILVARHDTQRVERISTPGPWLGIRQDVSAVAVNSTLTLRDKDLLILFTDGVIEAMNANEEQFDIDRLCALIETHQHEPPAAVRQYILDAVTDWMVERKDDISVVVARYRAASASSTPVLDVPG